MGGPADLPPWAVEVALTIERPVLSEPDGTDGASQAVMLLKAPSRARMLAGIAEAAVEVEAVLGLRPAIGPRVLTGRALPGLTPVTSAAALAHLGLAGARGLPVPLRRRQPAVSWTEPSWQFGAGSVVTCDGQCGTSAQAVTALRGLGNAGAITPPPGGALVLRAWRARRTWGLACGLVLGAAETLGLGREAGRVAAAARAGGWGAAVLGGSTALRLARAGDPRNPIPEATSLAASDARVAAMIDCCLAAGGLDHASGGSRWTLAVTP